MSDLRGLWLTRLLLQRGTACICLLAFVNALNQFRPLLGDNGLLPVRLFVQRVSFRESPSLFYLCPHDKAFLLVAVAGIVLSCLAISGYSERYGCWISLSVWLLIYFLYLSFVNVGQTFYGFGWESILLEACFFAAFLGDRSSTPSVTSVLLFRWLLFRVMFGAGLIKLRGDSCWKDWTCLQYFYETQPMPNPLSWYLHWSPLLGKAGVLWNHFAELIVPFAYFLPQPYAGMAGIVTILFQATIIMGGNLSWLNWLTLILAFSCLDSHFFSPSSGEPTTEPSAPVLGLLRIGLTVLVALMSIPVIANMLSRTQVMNTSFNNFHLVGTYGAFGSITRTRYEIVVEGTSEANITPATQWKEYEFKAKPTNILSMPPQIAPYHLRLDWLMWFAAMSDYQSYPWFVNLLAKLLHGDSAVLGLLRDNPFPHHPPVHIRAVLYEYHFTNPAERSQTGQWWKRTFAGSYFPPVSLQDDAFTQMLRSQGWAD